MAFDLSVIITTHRRPLLLSRAVQSIKQQGLDRVQLIVVSDVHEPQSYAVTNAQMGAGDIFVQRPGVPGPSASRNMGVLLAQAPQVMFLDDDDSHAPDFLAKLLPLIPAGSQDVIVCDGYVAHESRQPDGVEVESMALVSLAGVTHADLAVKNRIPNNCLIFPRELLLAHPFDEHLVILEDWEHLLHALSVAPLRHVPVAGPITHHNAQGELTRNNSNPDRLIDTILTVYRRWPAPSEAVRQARMEYFKAAGVELPLAVF
ncbi:MAG TPA: glycosyltransferase family 2 protein [Aquabacterium sp.]|nr:glycosyltransferase family 2 protein [Aquabacterium sp.]HRH27148.1 glycosyltransferase family 2 protein [Aquabacterium sp.]